jgi:hypothetical protein
MKTFKFWLNENEQDKKKIFVLVGPPSVGKSTWIKNTFPEKPYVINRDDIAENIANQMGLTYDDMFATPPPDAQIGDTNPKYGKVIKSPPYMTWQPLSYQNVLEANDKIANLLKDKINNATSQDKDIVVDMTNMSAKARQNALNAIKGKESEYEKIAVVFPFQGAENIIKKVNKKRAEEIKAKGGSKTVPDHAFDRMFATFQDVHPDEGFDQIITKDNRELLKQLADY